MKDGLARSRSFGRALCFE